MQAPGDFAVHKVVTTFEKKESLKLSCQALGHHRVAHIANTLCHHMILTLMGNRKSITRAKCFKGASLFRVAYLLGVKNSSLIPSLKRLNRLDISLNKVGLKKKLNLRSLLTLLLYPPKV